MTSIDNENPFNKMYLDMIYKMIKIYKMIYEIVHCFKTVEMVFNRLCGFLINKIIKET